MPSPLLILILTLQASPFVCAQPGKRKLADVPDSEIKKSVAEFDEQGILEVGHRKRVADINLLKRIASKTSPSESEIHEKTGGETLLRASVEEGLRQKYSISSRAARKALARLKEHGYLEEFVGGLTSSTTSWRLECIRAVGYIGDERAIQSLAPLLYDNGPADPNSYPIEVGSIASVAALSLGRILPHIAGQLRESRKASGGDDVLAWREWWEREEEKNRPANAPSPTGHKE